MKKLSYVLLALLCLTSCVRERQKTNIEGQYAQGFRLTDAENYTEVVVYDPWCDTVRVMQRYYLVRDMAVETPADGVKLHIPITRLAITSSTHAGFLDALGETRALCGVCSPEIIYTDIPSEEEGCLNMGDAMQLNIERVLMSGAQAVMISTYAQGDGARERLEKVNIPIIYNNEWTEATPLGRAEWLRFVGAFFDKAAEADSIFRQIEREYQSLQQIVDMPDNERRTLMTGANFRGTWYMPSGNTYTARLYRDAGAKYRYEDSKEQGSLPLSIETVLVEFKDADVWIGSNATTLDELRQSDEKHTWFKAYQTGEVFHFRKRMNSTGGNDFWESGVVHPERLLADVIWAVYPDKMTDYEPFYIEKLK